MDSLTDEISINSLKFQGLLRKGGELYQLVGANYLSRDPERLALLQAGSLLVS